MGPFATAVLGCNPRCKWVPNLGTCIPIIGTIRYWFSVGALGSCGVGKSFGLQPENFEINGQKCPKNGTMRLYGTQNCPDIPA